MRPIDGPVDFPADPFAARLRALLRADPGLSTSLRLARGATAYHAGGNDRSVYLVESGLVKVVAVVESGRECLLSLHPAGDVFGELCLAQDERAETATAMQPTLLRKIPVDPLLAALRRAGALDEYVASLARRLAEQQQWITGLVLLNGELRLAARLLLLAARLGRPDGAHLRIEHRITQEELSRMVGTTRSRVGHFLGRFAALGLVSRGPGAVLRVEPRRLRAYLEANL